MVAERYSKTAEIMAVQRGLESLHPARRRLFEDPFAPRLVSSRWRLLLAAATLPPLRALIEQGYDRQGGPGPRASAVARTRLIDDFIAEAEGIRQLIILGAGFDSRAYRIPELRGRVVFEVDHPDTQAVKRRRLGDVIPSRELPVRFVPVDFERDDLVVALRDAGFDAGEPSIFLWEGVTNYLTAEAVDATLGAVRRLAGEGGALIFTYVDRAVLDGHAEAFPEARRWLAAVAKRGEPWTFGLDPATLPAFLEARGFEITSDLSTAEAGERYFRQAGRQERGSGLYHVVLATIRGSR